MTVYVAEVTVTAPVHPTESEERVLEAVSNLFPGADAAVEEPPVEAMAPRVRAETRSVEHLRELFGRFGMQDAASDHLSARITGDVVEFRLKKQSAFVGRPSFDVGGHELGALAVRVESPEPEGVVDHLTSWEAGE